MRNPKTKVISFGQSCMRLLRQRDAYGNKDSSNDYGHLRPCSSLFMAGLAGPPLPAALRDQAFAVLDVACSTCNCITSRPDARPQCQ